MTNWGAGGNGYFLGNTGGLGGQNLLGANGGPNSTNPLTGFNPSANFNMQAALMSGAGPMN
jgi:hypothetical protein